MFRRLLLVCLISSMSVVSSAGVWSYFDNDSGDQKWSTVSNWKTIDWVSGQVADTLPDYDNPQSDVYLGIEGYSTVPVIIDGTQATAEAGFLTIGFNRAGQLDIVSGGKFIQSGATMNVGGHPAGTSAAYGVLNIDGAASLALAELWFIGLNGGTGVVNVKNGGTLSLGWWGTTIGDTGTGTLNIINGIVYYYGGGLNIGANGCINIYSNSEFQLYGDQTASVNSLVAAGKIRGDGVAGTAGISVTFDEDLNLTYVVSNHASQEVLTLSRGVSFDRQFHTIPVEAYCDINPADVQLVKQLGFDFAKVLINPSLIMNSDGTINTTNVWYVDELVNKFVSQDVNLVVCIHPETSFKTNYLGSAGEFAKLLNFYQDFAAYLSARWGRGEIAFELMTEPHQNYLSWNMMLPQMWQAARAGMPDHILILDSDDVASIDRLIQLTPVPDPNVYYSFTTYVPFIFTLQGGYWMGSYYPALQRVPYPSSPAIIAAEKSRILNFLVSEGYDQYYSAVDSALTAYGNENWNKAKHLAIFAPITAWNNANGGNLKVFCAEFGVLDAPQAQRVSGIDVGADPNDRITYLKDIREALEESNISWSVWSFNETLTILDPDLRIPASDNPLISWIDNPTQSALDLPLCGCGCKVQPSSPFDFNKDCYLNFLDFSMFAQSWLECTETTDESCL